MTAEAMQNGTAGAAAVEAWVASRRDDVERVRMAVHEIAASGLTLVEALGRRQHAGRSGEGIEGASLCALCPPSPSRHEKKAKRKQSRAKPQVPGNADIEIASLRS